MLNACKIAIFHLPPINFNSKNEKTKFPEIGKSMLEMLTEIRDSRHIWLAKYTVFDEESESEVKKCQTSEPGGKQ